MRISFNPMALQQGEDGAGQGAGGQTGGNGDQAAAGGSTAGDQQQQTGGTAGDTGGGKTGLLASAAASAQSKAGDQQQQGDQSDKTVAQRPDTVPEQFWDAKKGVINTDALLKAHRDTKADYDRLKAAGTSKAPEKPEDYTFDLKDVEHLKAPSADDPGLQLWRQIAHKNNLTQAQAQSIAADMLAGSVPFVPKPINPEAEMEALGKNGKAMVDGVFQWVQGAKNLGILNDAEMARVLDLGSDAMGIRALAKLREMSGEKPFAMTHVIGDGELPTKEEWTRAFGEAVSKGDHAAIAKLEKQGEALFGTDPAGTSERNLGVAPRPAA